jgi:cytochrome d ubiquinol oxidase subunit I
VPVLFWSFRIMVALGFYFIFLFAAAFLVASRRRLRQNPWLLKLAFYSLPLPWIAAELGWIVAEYGRQPWIIDSVLPTFLGASNVPAYNVLLSLGGFVLFYTALAIVEVWLMLKYIRLGPTIESFPQDAPERPFLVA